MSKLLRFYFFCKYFFIIYAPSCGAENSIRVYSVGVDNKNLKKQNQEGSRITKLIMRELINIFDAEKSDRPEFETKMSEKAQVLYFFKFYSC